MRVLMLAQFYPPILGGIERHVQSLGRALAARGHEVAVATLQHAGQPAFEEDGAVRVHRVRSTMQRLASLHTTDRQHSPPFPDPEVTLALRQIVETERPEIVHAHNWIVHSYLPIARTNPARLVVTLHDCELACVQMRMMYRDRTPCAGPALLRCARCAAHHYGAGKGAGILVAGAIMSNIERSLVDQFLPVSRAVARANRLDGPRSRALVVPNFVPDDVADGAPLEALPDPRLASLPESGFILQVGDLTLDKGIGVLLDAYAGLAAAPPLVLIGRRFAETPSALPANVTVIDGLPHHLVMEAWRRSLFGVVPSTCFDACPTVTLEAMAVGRPVVGSRTGGIPDQIVDGETGLLVPPDDAPALRAALARLGGDAATRVKMGEAARCRAALFQAGHVVSSIEDVYRRLLAGGRRRAVAAPSTGAD